MRCTETAYHTIASGLRIPVRCDHRACGNSGLGENYKVHALACYAATPQPANAVRKSHNRCYVPLSLEVQYEAWEISQKR